MLRGWVALSGTPGVGKSTLADRLRLHGIPSVDVGRLAQDYDLVESFDDRRLSGVVDPRRVAPVLSRLTQGGSLLLLEGHWSHEIPGVGAAVVLRLRPSLLERRLHRRGWSQAKIQENVEAEALDIVLQEAVGRLGRRRVFEIDATRLGRDTLARTAYAALRGTATARRRLAPGRTDWSHDLFSRL